MNARTKKLGDRSDCGGEPEPALSALMEGPSRSQPLDPAGAGITLCRENLRDPIQGYSHLSRDA